MKRLLLLSSFFIATQLFAQKLNDKWLVYEGSDGSELVLHLLPDGFGYAELSLTRRSLAASYAEGSQFWGTFRATGGYYFLVKGSKAIDIQVTQRDSTLCVAPKGAPASAVVAWLDEAYSTRDLSDEGGYKKQVVAQWKRDLPRNEDVEKQKWMMEHYFQDFYGDAFEVLLFGEYRIIEITDSTLILKKNSLDIPPMNWRRM